MYFGLVNFLFWHNISCYCNFNNIIFKILVTRTARIKEDRTHCFIPVSLIYRYILIYVESCNVSLEIWHSSIWIVSLFPVFKTLHSVYSKGMSSYSRAEGSYSGLKRWGLWWPFQKCIKAIRFITKR